MTCRKCASRKTKVIDSREIDGGAIVWRRRECKRCGERWTTYEQEIGNKGDEVVVRVSSDVIYGLLRELRSGERDKASVLVRGVLTTNIEKLQ